MAGNYEDELKGSYDEAIASGKHIAKKFAAFDSIGVQDTKKYQLIYATKVTHAIAKCDLKHSKIYCDIITETFGDRLHPEINAKYWESYVSNIRFFHYCLAAKKEYDLASILYNHISLYNNQVENENISLKLINIYSYHLILQSSRLSSNRQMALREVHNILDNMTFLYQEMLEKNKQFNLHYKDILKNSVQYLFPRTGQSCSLRILNELPQDKALTMFQSMFKLSIQKPVPKQSIEEVQQYGQSIIEILYSLLNFDLSNKFRLQLSIELLNLCRANSQIKSDKILFKFYYLLYEYMKLICLQTRVKDFPKSFTQCCNRFKELFDAYSKSVMSQAWFRDFLVLFTYLHIQLQNIAVFSCFWEQMDAPVCCSSLLVLLLETMKLAPCISMESSFNWATCCSSFRKHIIVSFAQTALSTFVLYCQNRVSEKEKKNDEITTDTTLYPECVHKTLLLIVNHAFKVIDKMDCIASTSQDISHLIKLFKQAAVNAKTPSEADTCVELCALYLKIKTKIPEIEWPLMLRRVYKVVEQCMINNWQLKRELQMCYITSMLQLSSELDFTQIRAQITIYFSQAPIADKQEITPPDLVHEKCLLHMYQQSSNALKPLMSPTQKKLLHWLETQHIVKYYKSNDKLMLSLMQCSPSQYDFVTIARLEKVQTQQVLTKLEAIRKSLKSKSEESAGLTRLECLTYAHTCVVILQEQKNALTAKANKFDSTAFAAHQLGNLLALKEMEALTIRKELSYVKLAYVAYNSFKQFYARFDSERINSDDALIDWEAIVDDLAVIAQFFQLCGYIEYSSHAWLLLHNISQLLQDTFSSFRSLAFFCEYSEHFGEGTDKPFQTDKEIQSHLPALTEELKRLSYLSLRKQSYVLLATIQIAYHYARCAKYNFAQMLIQFVEQKHNELPERQGRYDVVMCTLDIVRYRLLWKYHDDSKTSNAGKCALLNQSLMRALEQTIEHFRNFVCLTSTDTIHYVVLLCNLLQDVTECSANRLYDNFMSNVFTAVCKVALTQGLALRMVQLMSSWMWINLQMELVDDAHTNLRIMEYVMGVASLNELADQNVVLEKTDVKPSVFVPCTSIDTFSMGHNNGIEAMRRLTQAQLSPIKTGKLQLSSLARKRELISYLSYEIGSNSIPMNELFEWMFFIIGCFHARLNFLIEDFDQLEDFYENSRIWLQKRKNCFHKSFFKGFQLVAMQHFANFLRACRKTHKAKQYLNNVLEQCESAKMGIDAVYRVNFKLQLLSTRLEIKNCIKLNVDRKDHKSPKPLIFNLLPEEDRIKHEKALQEVKNQILQQAMGPSKKPIVTIAATPSVSSTATARKQKVAPSSGSGSSSPELKRKTKTKLKFNICTDSIELIDLNTNDNAKKCDAAANHKAKSTTPTSKTVKSLYNLSKTDTLASKTPSKTKQKSAQPTVSIDLFSPDSPPNSNISSSSCATAAKHKAKSITPTSKTVKSIYNNLSKTDTLASKTPSKTRQKSAQPSVSIDLFSPDSPPKSTNISLSSSSLYSLESKENQSENELVMQMEKLKMAETKQKQELSGQGRPTKTPNIATAVINLDDSSDVEPLKTVPRRRIKTYKTPDDITKESTHKATQREESLTRSAKNKNSKELTSVPTTAEKHFGSMRRQRKMISYNNTPECKQLTPNTTSAGSIAFSSISTRRRQNI